MGNFDITWSTIQNCVRFHQLNHLEALILLVIQQFSNFLGHFHYLANRQQKSKWAGAETLQACLGTQQCKHCGLEGENRYDRFKNGLSPKS